MSLFQRECINANIVTGYETWVHYFEQLETLETKYGLLGTVEDL